MTDAEVQQAVDELGLHLDEGNLIGGPFITDGTCRIHPVDEPFQILGQGSTPQEAWEDLPVRYQDQYTPCP